MDGAQPHVTIVVPTHARPAQLATCLGALAALEYPRDRFDVVVVDDGSPEPPVAEVRAAESDLDVTLVSQPRAGPAAARNAGVARATGELIAFTDDDCAPTPRWLAELATALALKPDAMVGGRTLNALTRNPYATAAQAIVSHLYTYYNGGVNGGFLASNNIAMALDAFREVGGFDTRFPRAAAEDREFCDRWLRAGRRIVLAGEAVVWHAHPLTLTRLLRQQFEYGRGAYWYHVFRTRAGGGPLRPEPPAFYVDLLRTPFHEQSHHRAVVAALIALAQVANAAGFASEMTRPKSSGDVTAEKTWRT